MANAQPAQPFGNPNDPWTLSSNSYDPATFYTRATDGNGHDSVIQTKVSPALLGEIQRLIQSKAIPQYRTNADLVRDALIHRLRYLSDEYPGSANLQALEIEQRQAEIDNIRVQRESWNKLLTDLDKQLEELIQLNELDEAAWLIEQNEYNDSMTIPFLLRLMKIIKTRRSDLMSARQMYLLS